MEFMLGILGLTRVERMAVASVCSLTQSRSRGYAVLPQERSADADITLVDADSQHARDQWASSPARKVGRPALMISHDPARFGEEGHSLSRAHFASRLIRILDQITIREFKYVPEINISDTNVFTKDFRLTPGAARPPSANLRRALVVDDSAVVRTKMSTLLGLHGMQADIAKSGEEALEFVRSNRYDIVFLDVVMPGIDGYAACRQMKLIVRDAPPIVMLTGRDSPFDKIRGVMAGCSRYLTKPISAEDFYKVLREFLPDRIATPRDGN